MRVKRTNPFKLKDFRGIRADVLTQLERVGLKTAIQMLAAGQTPTLRAALAKQAGIAEEAVLELVKLSDLSRLPGVKGLRARLYYDAGVDTVEKLAACEPKDLLSLTSEFVQKTGFEGIAPLPKEVNSTIETARKLPRVIEW
jgi:predicted RecB family nuclease